LNKHFAPYFYSLTAIRSLSLMVNPPAVMALLLMSSSHCC